MFKPSIIRISVAHSAAWVHEWSTQKLHKMLCLTILAHVLFIWAGNIYMVKLKSLSQNSKFKSSPQIDIQKKNFEFGLGLSKECSWRLTPKSYYTQELLDGLSGSKIDKKD